MASTHSTDPSPARRSIFPQDGDDWASIAARELRGTPAEEAVNLLQSWNLHVFMRPAADSAGQGNPILPSDIIFVEPPPAERP